MILNIDELIKELFNLHNNYRNVHKLPSLIRNSILDTTALQSVAHCQKVHKLEHYNPFIRMKQNGYNYRYAGENIAQLSPRSTGNLAVICFNLWLSDRPHRDNILNDQFKDIGIAISDYLGYWAVDFGSHY